ncbi:MAG: hypothetical protein AB7O24_01125 [Kofleriaceae bacterium]
MTTIPARNGTLLPTIASLLEQTRKPDEIRFYVVPGVDYPARGLHGAPGVPLNCVPVDDIGPLTKLSAAVDPELPDDAIIVTVDDDIAYGRTWLETLIAGAERNRCEAVGFSGWDVASLIARNTFRMVRSGRCDVLEGWSGAAYRRGWFEAGILQPPPEFRCVDDVWISAYLHRRGISRRVIARPLCRPRDEHPGLHNRADFRELNRRAAQLGFA